MVKSGFWNGKHVTVVCCTSRELLIIFSVVTYFFVSHSWFGDVVEKKEEEEIPIDVFFFFPQSLDAHRKNRESWVQIAYWDERWDYKRAEIFYLKSERNSRWSRCWGLGTCFRIISSHFWSLYILQSSSSLVTRIAWEARETAFTNH